MTDDDDADMPRSGWHGGPGGFGLVEIWTREAVGLTGMVIGGLGAWSFAVSENGRIIAHGESGRRGWAMDGADDGFPTLN